MTAIDSVKIPTRDIRTGDAIYAPGQRGFVDVVKITRDVDDTERYFYYRYDVCGRIRIGRIVRKTNGRSMVLRFSK